MTMAPRATSDGSRYHAAIRNFPLDKAERLWNAGKTIRKYPAEGTEPLPVWERPQPKSHASWCSANGGTGKGLCIDHQRELDHLLATSEPVPASDYSTDNRTVNTRERTIAQELHALGMSTRSLDAPVMTDEGPTTFDIADRHLSITPYNRPTPLTIRRIERERRDKLSGRPIRFRIKVDPQPHVQILGVQSAGNDAQIRLAKAYLTRLKALRPNHDLPTPAQIQQFNRQIADLRKAGHRANLRLLHPDAEATWYATHYDDFDDDPQRNRLTADDLELHDAAIITEEPDPEEHEFAAQNGIHLPVTKLVLLRGKPGAYQAYGVEPNSGLLTPTDLELYYATLMRRRNDYLASQTSMSLDMNLAATEWDLGLTFEDNLLDLTDEDPLSLLTD